MWGSNLGNVSTIGSLNLFIAIVNDGSPQNPQKCNQNTGGVCNTPPSLLKQCPSSSPYSNCSGNGTCNFFSSAGSSINSCAFNDTTCVALCACRSGYAGSGCELTNLEFEGLSKLRGQACTALGNLSASSAKSDTLVSFQEIFQPQNVNSESASICVSVLSQTLLPGLTLGGSVNDNEIAKVVTSIISSVGESNYYASLQGSGDPPENGAIKSLLNSFTTSLQMNMSAVQTHNLSAGVLAISVVARSIFRYSKCHSCTEYILMLL